MLRLVGPTSHSGNGGPPGQVWPPPLIVYSTTLASSAQSVYSRRVTSGAAADSTGVGEQRFLRAQFAVHSGMLGNGSGASHTLAPLYGANRSPVPWNAIIGAGRGSGHQSTGSVTAAATGPNAAMRWDNVHDSANVIPPPLERPFA